MSTKNIRKRLFKQFCCNGLCLWFVFAHLYLFLSKLTQITFEAVEACWPFSWGRGGFRDCRAGEAGTVGSWVSAPYPKNLQGAAGSNLSGLGQGQAEVPGDQRELGSLLQLRNWWSGKPGNKDHLPGQGTGAVLSANLVWVFSFELSSTC